jgi:hypothetical protein
MIEGFILHVCSDFKRGAVLPTQGRTMTVSSRDSKCPGSYAKLRGGLCVVSALSSSLRLFWAFEQ